MKLGAGVLWLHHVPLSLLPPNPVECRLCLKLPTNTSLTFMCICVSGVPVLQVDPEARRLFANHALLQHHHARPQAAAAEGARVAAHAKRGRSTSCSPCRDSLLVNPINCHSLFHTFCFDT